MSLRDTRAGYGMQATIIQIYTVTAGVRTVRETGKKKQRAGRAGDVGRVMCVSCHPEQRGQAVFSWVMGQPSDAKSVQGETKEYLARDDAFGLAVE